MHMYVCLALLSQISIREVHVDIVWMCVCVHVCETLPCTCDILFTNSIWIINTNLIVNFCGLLRN